MAVNKNSNDARLQNVDFFGMVVWYICGLENLVSFFQISLTIFSGDFVPLWIANTFYS